MKDKKNLYVIILSLVQIGILYHVLTYMTGITMWTKDTRSVKSFEMSNSEDFNNNKMDLSSLCGVVVPADDDPAYRFFYMATRLIDHLCKQRRVNWFLWGDVSLRLHQFGARLLTSPHDQIHVKDKATFEIYIASDDVRGIEQLLKDILFESTKQPFLECSAKPIHIVPIMCTAKPVTGRIILLYIHAPAVMDMKTNQLTMTDDNLLIKYAYKLDRIFPLKCASYYALQVPVPKDPIYAFSHVVPFKGYRQPDLLQFKYVQGCPLVSHDVPLDINGQDVVTCGENLLKNGSANLFESCFMSKPEEVVVQLDDLIKSQAGEAIIRLEDFRDVIVVHRGYGSYNLHQPNGRTQVNGTPSWSQYGQDRFVDNYFHNKTGGFFIEIGGYDGEKLSNSLYFEKLRGWDGLLVEAIPKLYKIIQSKDRKCNFINACISNEDAGLVFTMADYLSSSNKQMPDRHLQRIHKSLITVDKNNTHEEVYVNCKSLMSILNKLGVRKVDYFSLDVEGTELFLLKSIDWDHVDIELFSIETDHRRQAIIDFMASKGYDRIDRLKGDDFFSKRRT